MLLGSEISFSAQPTPVGTPSTLETVRTAHGLEVSFPAALYANIDPNAPNRISLTNLQPDADLRNMTLQDADAWAGEESPTLDDVQESILRSVRLIGRTIDDAPVVELPNGNLTIIPYALDDGSAGLFALLVVPQGPIVVAEIMAEGSQQLANLIENPQAWISILASVRFVPPAQENTAALPQLQLPARPLTLTEMPTDTLIFASDVVLRLTPNWQLADATGKRVDRIVEDTATIAYNSAQALATIVVVRTDGVAFVDWRDSLLEVMGSALLATDAPAAAEVYERSDGRIIEQYTSADLALALFFVDLGGDRAAYVLVTMIEAQEIRRREILASLQALLLAMSRFERV
jgi:hypothetical protein